MTRSEPLDRERSCAIDLTLSRNRESRVGRAEETALHTPIREILKSQNHSNRWIWSDRWRRSGSHRHFFWHRENEGEDRERRFCERIRTVPLRGQVAADPSTIKISAFWSLGFGEHRDESSRVTKYRFAKSRKDMDRQIIRGSGPSMQAPSQFWLP
jgi:hypothetical protein